MRIAFLLVVLIITGSWVAHVMSDGYCQSIMVKALYSGKMMGSFDTWRCM